MFVFFSFSRRLLGHVWNELQLARSQCEKFYSCLSPEPPAA
jgi:hypothetical protein